LGGRPIGDGVTSRQLPHSLDVRDRRAETKEVLDQLLSRLGVGRQTGLHGGAADDAHAGVRPHQIEVLNLVAVAVHVALGLDAMAQLQLEADAPLAVAVHGAQPELHDRLGDRPGVSIPRAVHDLELHCCCCWGMPRSSSPATAAGTLVGWKYVWRRATSSDRHSVRHSSMNSRGWDNTRAMSACWYTVSSRPNNRRGLDRRALPSILDTASSALVTEKRADRGSVPSSSRHSTTRSAATPPPYLAW